MNGRSMRPHCQSQTMMLFGPLCWKCSPWDLAAAHCIMSIFICVDIPWLDMDLKILPSSSALVHYTKEPLVCQICVLGICIRSSILILPFLLHCQLTIQFDAIVFKVASILAVPALQIWIQISISTWFQLGQLGFFKVWLADKSSPIGSCTTVTC